MDPKPCGCQKIVKGKTVKIIVCAEHQAAQELLRKHNELLGWRVYA